MCGGREKLHVLLQQEKTCVCPSGKLFTDSTFMNLWGWGGLLLLNILHGRLCIFNLVEVWYSLEQYIGLKEDKLSSTTVDFIRSEGNLETKHLYWFSKPKIM